MNTLGPFFLLAGRPAVFVLGALGLIFAGFTVTGLASPDERIARYFDAVLVATLLFPGLAGRLAGAVVQEFQGTSVAMLLPRVRSRIASGFLVTGIAVSAIVVASIALKSSTSMSLAALFAVGLGAYCLGGIFVDPLAPWIATLNTVVALLLMGRSRDVSELIVAHPLLTTVLSLGVGGLSLFRLFARSTFRRKPLVPASPLPGRYSLERSQERERRRVIRDRRSKTTWHAGYLGSDSWRWVRAALHEAHGAHGWKATLRGVSRAWGVGLLFLIYAWADRGDMGFGEALARSIYDALFRSPHEPQFGESGGPFLMVLIFIAAAGGVSALYRPVALYPGLAHPISRGQRASVHFRGGLVDAALFLLVATFIYIGGHLTGRLVGIELRFDFMPYYFRALMLTLILMPLAYRGRLGLLAATRRGAENTMLAVIFGVTGFVIAVLVLSAISAGVFVSPLAELVVLVAALAVSLLLYRQSVRGYYRTADLA